ncbi:caspase domain-containing protein, partial [uncultured Methylobacterium sp.]|uniref:caspase family protein n=1 Tax=uncultured Methylobacterium sp. TaxID=157278 RepID=UPI0035C9E07E
VGDAAAIGQMLRTAGFASVVTLSDPTLADLKRALADLSTAARDADIAVAFYAGHGVETGSTAYLVPAGATIAQRADLDAAALPLDAIVAATAPARRLGLVLFDASRSDPFAGSAARRPATRVPASEPSTVPSGGNTLVGYATGTRSDALEGTGAHSPFTAALLAHLATPGLDIRLAFTRIRDAVLKATDRRQEPYLYGSLGGETVSLAP